jgi:DNA-binding transcriptional LysR family regulator
MRPFEWSDVRYFLAVARDSSALSASRKLKVSQTTVVRRLAALEESLGLTLFERRQAGYRLTDDGVRLLAKAEALESAAAGFGDEAAAAARELSGTVLFTTNELAATEIVPKMLRVFRDSHPDIRVETVVSEAMLDLGAGDADVALRAGPRPDTPGLYARKILDDPWAICCSRDYAERYGRPDTPESLGRHIVIGLAGHAIGDRGRDWLLAIAPGARIEQVTSLTAMIAQVRAGLGVGAVPMHVQTRDADLIFCFPVPEQWTPGVWLVTHERVRQVPRVRAFIEFAASYLKSEVATVTADPPGTGAAT